jgi:hypothetical protein
VCDSFELQVCARKSVKFILWYSTTHYIVDPLIVLKYSTWYELSSKQIWPNFENEEKQKKYEKLVQGGISNRALVSIIIDKLKFWKLIKKTFFEWPNMYEDSWDSIHVAISMWYIVIHQVLLQSLPCNNNPSLCFHIGSFQCHIYVLWKNLISCLNPLYIYWCSTF